MLGKTFITNVYALAGKKPAKKHKAIRLPFAYSRQEEVSIEVILHEGGFQVQVKYLGRIWDDMVSVRFCGSRDGGEGRPASSAYFEVEYGEIHFHLFENPNDYATQIYKLGDFLRAAGCIDVVRDFMWAIANDEDVVKYFVYTGQ